MEQQLSTYQDFNREGCKISDEFHSDILSVTSDINHAIGPNKNKSGLRGLILSKLTMISESIDEKRKSDERRASESEIKIVELQNNLKSYEQELLQIRKRYGDSRKRSVS